MTDRWRSEFPYRWDADERVARRELLGFAVYTSGPLFASTAALAARGRLGEQGGAEPRRILPLAELREGEAHYFRYPGPDDEAVLVRLTASRLVAYSQRCTHLSCAVVYQPVQARLYCPCHDGVFQLETGDPIAGPPRRRLPRIDVGVEDGIVIATGIRP